MTGHAAPPLPFRAVLRALSTAAPSCMVAAQELHDQATRLPSYLATLRAGQPDAAGGEPPADVIEGFAQMMTRKLHAVQREVVAGVRRDPDRFFRDWRGSLDAALLELERDDWSVSVPLLPPESEPGFNEDPHPGVTGPGLGATAGHNQPEQLHGPIISALAIAGLIIDVIVFIDGIMRGFGGVQAGDLLDAIIGGLEVGASVYKRLKDFFDMDKRESGLKKFLTDAQNMIRGLVEWIDKQTSEYERRHPLDNPWDSKPGGEASEAGANKIIWIPPGVEDWPYYLDTESSYSTIWSPSSRLPEIRNAVTQLLRVAA